MKKEVKKKAAKKKTAPVQKKAPAKKTVAVKKTSASISAAKPVNKKKMPLAAKIAAWIVGVFVALVLFLVIAVYASTYHPADVMSEEVFNAKDAPVMKAGQKVKILTWNVQYMGSKNYVFFYDTYNGDGPDIRPSSKDIAWTINEVVRVIKEENPDVVFLQEVDDNAKRTDYENQVARLMSLLPKEYSSYTAAWYWKAAFVPHPKIMGRVGMKNVIISKYKIREAIRYQLPLMPDNILFPGEFILIFFSF